MEDAWILPNNKFTLLGPNRIKQNQNSCAPFYTLEDKHYKRAMPKFLKSLIPFNKIQGKQKKLFS